MQEKKIAYYDSVKSAILISIFLLFSFIACSSETPEPPAVEEPPATEFDKADETLTSLDDLFAASLPEKQEDGSLVSTVENTVVDGKKLNQHLKQFLQTVLR